MEKGRGDHDLRRKGLKRATLALAGTIAALALPVAATGASSADSAAKLQRGGQDLVIKFTLRSRDGEPTKIKRFRWKNLTMECNGGVTVDTEGIIRTMEVNDRNRFRGSINRDGRRVKVRGRVAGDLSSVRGTIRARGPFAGATGCDSGRVRWNAS